MWLQRWLGHIYGKAFLEFGEDLFTLDDLKKLTQIEEKKLRIAISLLKKNFGLIRFVKKRKSFYRLFSPLIHIFLCEEKIKNLDLIPPSYVHLIAKALFSLRKMEVLGICLFGSVARGEYKKISDIDLMVISPSFPKKFGRRIDLLAELERENLKNEMEWLAEKGIYTHVSWTPFKPEELKSFPPILLDVQEDGIILFERNDYLSKVFACVRAELAKLGAKRIKINESWFWDIKPDLKAGEVLKIELLGIG